MIITLSEQTLIFLYSCFFGVLLSCYFDVFRVIRLITGNLKIITLVCDLFFFLSGTVFVYLFFVRFCSGQIRVYVLIGELLGFLICHFSISALFMRLSVIVVRKVKRFLRFISRPFVSVSRSFKEKILKRRKEKKEKRNKNKKNIENSLQPNRNVVYNLLKIYRKNLKREDAVREKERNTQT